MSKGTEFMQTLIALIDDYDANLYYTIDDDGIHIDVGDECFKLDGWEYDHE